MPFQAAKSWLLLASVLKACSDDTFLVSVLDASNANNRAPGDTTRLVTAYTGLQQLGGFAHSHKQESEADRIGMIIMA